VKWIAELGEWWTDFQNADGEKRAEMLMPEQAGDKKRRRRRKKPANSDVDRNISE
jgi:poly(A) polymerase